MDIGEENEDVRFVRSADQAVIELLKQRGPMTISDCARMLDYTYNYMSKVLSNLASAGRITKMPTPNKRGQTVYVHPSNPIGTKFLVYLGKQDFGLREIIKGVPANFQHSGLVISCALAHTVMRSYRKDVDGITIHPHPKWAKAEIIQVRKEVENLLIILDRILQSDILFSDTDVVWKFWGEDFNPNEIEKETQMWVDRFTEQRD